MPFCGWHSESVREQAAATTGRFAEAMHRYLIHPAAAGLRRVESGYDASLSSFQQSGMIYRGSKFSTRQKRFGGIDTMRRVELEGVGT